LTRGSSDVDDRALAALYLRRRDEAAFLTLYRRHTPALFGFALRLCGGRAEEAEEIVQETWIRAAERLESFRWVSSLRTWLSGIAVNCWREQTRRPRPDQELREREGAADRALGLPGERIDLARAVGELPGGYRAVLLLHDVEGFTHEEIAKLLGIEPGTSKSQLTRARQAMRRRLAGK
jgi:RNA polymerase sigma-70 factor (ECF subfamily)